MSFARWLNTAVLEKTPRGLEMPGGGVAARWAEGDGREVSVISRGDFVELYVVTSKRDILQAPISTETAVQLAKWILRLWSRKLWWGLKLKLWRWSLGRMLTEKERAAH
jgi:hypothetical protein